MAMEGSGLPQGYKLRIWNHNFGLLLTTTCCMTVGWMEGLRMGTTLDGNDQTTWDGNHLGLEQGIALIAMQLFSDSHMTNHQTTQLLVQAWVAQVSTASVLQVSTQVSLHAVVQAWVQAASVGASVGACCCKQLASASVQVLSWAQVPVLAQALSWVQVPLSAQVWVHAPQVSQAAMQAWSVHGTVQLAICGRPCLRFLLRCCSAPAIFAPMQFCSDIPMS